MINSVWISSPLALMVAALAAAAPATAQTVTPAPMPTQPVPSPEPAPMPMQPVPPPTPAPAGPELQLETPRRTQQAQRLDFPLVNEESSFVFNFAQDVRTCLLSGLDGHLMLYNIVMNINAMCTCAYLREGGHTDRDTDQFQQKLHDYNGILALHACVD
jgi:hypothetical protein